MRGVHLVVAAYPTARTSTDARHQGPLHRGAYPPTERARQTPWTATFLTQGSAGHHLEEHLEERLEERLEEYLEEHPEEGGQASSFPSPP